MNHQTDERMTKGETVRFRIDMMRKKHWVEAMKELGVKDFSSYARQAVDAAFQRDFRAKDPKWQKFLKAVAPISREILGYELVDRPSDRMENQEAIERILFKRGQALAKDRKEPLTAPLTPGEGKRVLVVRPLKGRVVRAVGIIRAHSGKTRHHAHS